MYFLAFVQDETALCFKLGGDDHIVQSNLFVVDGNAAVCIEEKDLSGEKLIQEVSKYVNNVQYRKTTEENIKKFAVYDTLDRIICIVRELASKD